MLSVVRQKVVILRVLAPFLGICRPIVRPERNKNQIELKKSFDASMTKIRDKPKLYKWVETAGVRIVHLLIYFRISPLS
jgi:hypothetical protein